MFWLWAREVLLPALSSDEDSRQQPCADIWAGGAVAALGSAGSGVSTACWESSKPLLGGAGEWWLTRSHSQTTEADQGRNQCTAWTTSPHG